MDKLPYRLQILLFTVFCILLSSISFYSDSIVLYDLVATYGHEVTHFKADLFDAREIKKELSKISILYEYSDEKSAITKYIYILSFYKWFPQHSLVHPQRIHTCGSLSPPKLKLS